MWEDDDDWCSDDEDSDGEEDSTDVDSLVADDGPNRTVSVPPNASTNPPPSPEKKVSSPAAITATPSPLSKCDATTTGKNNGPIGTADTDDELPTRAKDATIPPMYIPESHLGKTKFRATNHSLHKLFGNRQLKDFKILSQTFKNLTVLDRGELPLTLGALANRKRRKRGGKSTPPSIAGHTVCVDIGCGDGVSPGGHRYCILFVDKATRQAWIFGLRDLHGDTITEALYKFVDFAGGYPKRLQCDFDTKFLGGKFRNVLRKNKVRVTAAPPKRQSQNGLVERTWATACNMARSFLAEARLPKRFWFWAVREAIARMNLIPIQYVSKENPLYTTSFEMYYGEKPDANMLYNFGSIGSFYKDQDGDHYRTKFEAQAHTGIAVGRHESSNSMTFWCPEIQRFISSADYSLDVNKDVKDLYPDIIYDGCLDVLPLHKGGHSPLPHSIGSVVNFVMPGGTPECVSSGHAVALPVPSEHDYYRVQLDDGSCINLDPSELWSPSEAIGGKDSHDHTQGDPTEVAGIN